MSETRYSDKLRFKTHFAFSRLPFAKGVHAAKMFDSSSQRELLQELSMWLEVRGLCGITGPAGAGKSITLRRFVQGLDQARYRVVTFSFLPTTTNGFLRSLCRALGLPMKSQPSDLFDQVQAYLRSHQQDQGSHPLIVVDDCEGLPLAVLDLLRRLTSAELDSDDHFSLVLSGTEELLRKLAHPSLETLRTRLSFVEMLRPFNLEDARNYVRYHLEHAGAASKLFSDQAVQHLFRASQGRPRSINQLAVQALIRAAVQGRDEIDGDFMNTVIAAHPMYQATKATSGGQKCDA
jgi:type II secretory pathway predicted ATPase ExeA